jgi:uncharacterized protein YbjT (DUF2867 family)
MHDSDVRRIIYVSHLGADGASAFPVLKAKAIAEEYIRHSKKEFTILRSGVLFGNGDQFTTGLAQLAHYYPFFFLIPNEGETLLHHSYGSRIFALVWSGLLSRDISVRPYPLAVQSLSLSKI